MKLEGYVYIVTNQSHSVLYTGVTSNLSRRISEHRNRCGSRFASRYKCSKLVYYESYAGIIYAIDQEKKLKNWKRMWKLNAIELFNPEWKDLYWEIQNDIFRPNVFYRV